MAPATAWLVVQRNLTGSVRVADTPEVWLTVIFTTPSRRVVGMHVAGTADHSLRAALTMAVTRPARGAPRQRPEAVLTSEALVVPVRDLLREAVGAVGVDEVVTPDWAEDLLGELTAHLAGRPQAGSPPVPEQWALLYQQTAAYVRAAPWRRRADDVHLRLEVSIGSRRADWVAIVTGNAGISRGLVLCSGRVVPPELLSDAPEAHPPPGTCHLALGPAQGAPPELRERALRYGWPPSFDEIPLFVTVAPEGPREIGRDRVDVMTVALAATIEHDRHGPGFGRQVTGELILAGGRRGRYRAELQANQPLAIPPGLQLLSGEVRFDWLPRRTFIALGGLPWTALQETRDRAARHLPPPRVGSAVGERLPLLILGMAATPGRRVARLLHDAHPEGVALVEAGERVVAMIITASGLYGVTSFGAEAAAAIARFQESVAGTNGWHAVIVSTPDGAQNAPVYGFFECVMVWHLGGASETRGGRRRRGRRGEAPIRGR